MWECILFPNNYNQKRSEDMVKVRNVFLYVYVYVCVMLARTRVCGQRLKVRFEGERIQKRVASWPNIEAD